MNRRGLVPLVALVALLGLTAPARAADPVMRLSEVRAGMRCTALSVVRGVQIASFDVEILDVVTGDPYAGGPRILVRVSGPAVSPSGVGEGFSGSPIYCPDGKGQTKNAGAISETLGDYGNDVVLATPIEQMLGQGPEAPRSSRRDAALISRARPLAAPLTISGLSAPMRARVSRAAKRAGRSVLTAPSGPAQGYPVQDLRPGSAVGVGMSTGDIAIGSIGTVTYRSGSAIWAFGHPQDGVGRRSLPLQDAYVFSVIENPLGIKDATTYKFAVTGHTVGTLSNDFLNAVSGRVGRAPRTIPFTASIRDEDTRRTHVIRSRVADERGLELGSSLDMVGTFALGQGSTQVLGSTPPRVSSSLCLRIVVRERRRPLGFCGRYADQVSPLEDASTALRLVDAFKFGRLTPLSVSARLRLRRNLPEAYLLRARAPRRVRRGQRLRIGVLLQRRRAGKKRVTLYYRVPRSARPGRRVLKLTGVEPRSPEVDFEERLEIALTPRRPGNGAGPRSLGALAESVASLRKSRDGLRATIAGSGRGPLVLSASKLLVRGKLRLPVVVRR